MCDTSNPKQAEALQFVEPGLSAIDKYSNREDGIFVDIGPDHGLFSLYGAKKFKRVVALELQQESVKQLSSNCKDNTDECNILIVSSFVEDLLTFFVHSNVNPKEITLFRISYYGKEEFVLPDIFRIWKEYDMTGTLMVTFNINEWENKNLGRFDFFTKEQVEILKMNPVGTTLLFFE